MFKGIIQLRTPKTRQGVKSKHCGLVWVSPELNPTENQWKLRVVTRPNINLRKLLQFPIKSKTASCDVSKKPFEWYEKLQMIKLNIPIIFFLCHFLFVVWIKIICHIVYQKQHVPWIPTTCVSYQLFWRKKFFVKKTKRKDTKID